MSNEYVVYPDKIRSSLSIIVYFIFLILEAYILFTNNFQLIWKVLLIAIMLFFVWQIVMSIRAIVKHDPLLVISDKGIKDYTSPVDFGLIPWSAIEKIETYPGSTSLQIGILVSKIYDFKNSGSMNAFKMAQRNRERTGHTISIDGFAFQSEKLRQIFNTCKDFGQKNNQGIIVKEYEDPFLKRRKKKGIKA
ncbi:MAG: STM3941 family protein [Bacillota bacterium]|nr:STM3941 family protein [Bacillota bacterium]